jgi:hypothetical protein
VKWYLDTIQRFLAERIFSALIIRLMKKFPLSLSSALIAGALFLGACGSSKASSPASDSTPVETTVGAETTVAAPTETPAPSESPTVPEGATTVASEAAATTVAGVAPAAASASQDAVAAMAAALGITDKKDLDCITSKIDPTAAPAAGGVDPNLIKALITCQPPALVDAAKGSLVIRLPNATPEQIDCVARASLKVLGESDGDVLSALTGGATSLPPELQSKFLETAKPCGLSEDDLKKATA